MKDLEIRTNLLEHLKENDIWAVFHYIPLHSSKAGQHFGKFYGEDIYTTTESERLIRLPMYYGLPLCSIDRVVHCIKDYYEAK